MLDKRVFLYSPQGGIQVFRGHFRTRWCLRRVFCGVMHHCVVRRSESVPTEIAEPTPEAQSSRHVFIETMQSKDFSEILLICVNFGVTVSRHCQVPWSKNLYLFSTNIRNIMGTPNHSMWEVSVIYSKEAFSINKTGDTLSSGIAHTFQKHYKISQREYAISNHCFIPLLSRASAPQHSPLPQSSYIPPPSPQRYSQRQPAYR